jgi:hypothetical protein
MDDGLLCVTAEAGQSTLLCAPYGRSMSYQASQQALVDQIQSLAFFRGSRPGELSDNVMASHSRHMIRNLALLDSAQDEATSTCDSKHISYAAVPIRSRVGQLLGTYTVMDTKIRNDYLSHETYRILDDLASATSRYLESQHVQLDKDHDTRANLNLSKFLEHNKPQPPVSPTKIRHLSGRTSSLSEPSRDNSSRSNSSSSNAASTELSIDDAASGTDETPLTTPLEEQSGFSFAKSPSASTACLLHQAPVTEPVELPTEPHGRPPHRALSVATSLIRAAHDLQGLVLLDATPSSVHDHLQPGHDATSEQPSMCEKLEISIIDAGHTPLRITSSMSVEDKSLDQLVSRFPQGCVLKAGDEGILALVVTGTMRSGPALYEKLDETVLIPPDVLVLLHQAQSLIFMPLWDSARQAFYAGMLGWPVDPMRVFSEHDLLSLSIYGRILTAEITRLGMYARLVLENGR